LSRLVLLVAALASLVFAAAPAAATANPPGAKQLGKRQLPLRVAPLSTLTGDNVGVVRLTLRPVKRARLGPVRIAFKDNAGTVLSRLRVADPSAEAVVSLPLAKPLRPGRYSLRLLGRHARGGKLLSTTQRLAFAAGGGWTHAAAASTGISVQKVVVDWYDGQWQGRELGGFVAPGVGFGEVVCRPDAQLIQFYPAGGGREVAMMNWTYKDWGTYREKSLREALYTSGTGSDFNEGLNKFGPAEKTSTGTFEGVISDRGPIGGPGGGWLAPPTTLSLSWQWDFTDPAASRCHVEAVFRTETAATVPPLARSVQVLWRGEANAVASGAGAIDFPGLGAVTVTCRPGEPRRLAVDSPAGARIVTREGSEDSVVTRPGGPLGVPLPNNGMVVVEVESGERILVASRWKLNDPDPGRNWCAIAAQVVSPGAP
jgi:hypothetical protein